MTVGSRLSISTGTHCFYIVIRISVGTSTSTRIPIGVSIGIAISVLALGLILAVSICFIITIDIASRIVSVLVLGSTPVLLSHQHSGPRWFRSGLSFQSLFSYQGEGFLLPLPPPRGLVPRPSTTVELHYLAFPGASQVYFS